MFNFKLICFVILLFNIYEIRCQISDKRLCANENCTKPISLAKTIIRYASPDNRILSFAQNVEVTVYSKSAGSNMALWGVEIKGQRGYVPKKFLRETRVFTKELPFLLDTKSIEQLVPSAKSDVQEPIKANKVPEYRVIDGTTFYNSPEDVAQVVEENTTIDTDIIEENHKETPSLNVKLDEFTEKNDILKNAEEVKDNSQKSDEKDVVMNNDKSKKEGSFAENVLQTITKWIGDEDKEKEEEEEEEDIVIEDGEDVNDFTEENGDEEEEEDGDDDYGDSEEDFDDSEEEDETNSSDDSNADNLTKIGYNDKSSDVIHENNGITEKEGISDVYNSNTFLNSAEENDEQTGDKNIAEDTQSLKEVDEKNGVKLRQLLSESLSNEEGSKIMLSTHEDNTEGNPKEVDEKVNLDLNNCKGENCQEKRDEEVGFSINGKESVESVTENGFTEMPEPHDYQNYVTSNPIENIQNESPAEANASLENKEQVSVDSINDNSIENSSNTLAKQDDYVKVHEGQLEKDLGTEQNADSKVEDRPEDIDSEKSNLKDIQTADTKIKDIANNINDENLNLSKDESVENFEVKESIDNIEERSDNQEQIDDVTTESTFQTDSSFGMSEATESKNPQNSESENKADNKSTDIETSADSTIENVEEMGEGENFHDSIQINAEKQGTIPSTLENIETQESDLGNKDQQHEQQPPFRPIKDNQENTENQEPDLGNKEQQQEQQPPFQPIKDNQENTENQESDLGNTEQQQEQKPAPQSINENISGILSEITNWFGSPQMKEIDDTIDKDNKISNGINQNVNVENQTEDTEVTEIDNTETNEKHDHDFISMINKQKDSIPLDQPGSSQTQQPNAAADEITDVPVEDISKELDKSDLVPELSEEVRNDEDISSKILPSYDVSTSYEELQKHEDLLASDNMHIFDVHDQLLSKNSVDYGSCPAGESECPDDISVKQKQLEMEEVSSSSVFSDYLNLLTFLGATGLSVVIFLLGFITIDKNRKEGTLIAKINTLEKALLVSSKENAFLLDKVAEVQNETAMENDRISSEEYEHLNKTYQETLMAKSALEDQIQGLEKELENSTEVGLELNRMLSDILSSQNGSDTLIANVEQLQRQLVEQQSTINTINDTLNLKDTENHELQLELEIKNKKVTHLQAELDKMAMNLFKVEEDKEQMQAKLEGEVLELKDQFEKSKNSFNSTRTKLLEEIHALKTKYSEIQRNLEVKTNEYTILKENFNKIKTIKNNTEALESLLNASSLKAELQQFQRDNQTLSELLRQEQDTKFTLEKQVEIALQEAQNYKAKYDESDKERLEVQTKLEVLSNYFKEREAQLQKELSKQESMWIEQQGEATSTIERIKYMQEELQNCKSQNELLKQEIVSQEVELKSQISVLEKKAHESWVLARQAERRLEDARQEAAQLRNRLTLKERSFIEDKGQNRIQSPLEQNGDVAISPLHMPVETPASPPLLFGTRDHLTTSPPLPNLPPFLPPPPGVPFMPPPIPGVPGFMPPPPSMFPVDHRPPPLGRMSSPPPPLNSRYSPDSRYSPYDRNSPSPPYDDDYGSSPPPLHRGYSPYNNRDDRRDFKRPPPPVRTNGRNKGAMSSGSGNSNESLEKINRHHSKV